MNEEHTGQPPSDNEQPPHEPQPQAPPPPYHAYGPPAQQAYPATETRRTRNRLLAASCAVGCLPWVILGLLFIAFVAAGSGVGGDRVALIRVSGVITAGQSGGGFLEAYSSGSDNLVEQLERARKNDDVKAIVLRIDSPGGSPAGSEEVYNEILRVRKDGKPVYTSMADVAASGGYYVAAASDTIYADASTLTGSIGVIWDVADMSGLYKKIGYRSQVVKSGKFKDIGSPDRPLTPEERDILQGIVMETYGHFVQAVADGRKIPVADVKKIADGRVFTGSQALKLKLVDEIGGLREATRAAARAGGIKGEPKVVEYERRGFLSALFGSESEKSHIRLQDEVAREALRRLLQREDAVRELR